MKNRKNDSCMIIRRENGSLIKKRRINFKNLDEYDEKKFNQAIIYLEDEIKNSFVSHFDNVSYTLEQFKKKNINFLDYNKNTGCITECKNLSNKLKKIGLKTYFVSCRAKVFSNQAGDALVKEAHVFLLWPTLRNKQIYFTIFDPRFRIENPISFYDTKDSLEIKYLSEGKAKVSFISDKSFYPYQLSLNKRINYKKQTAEANICWDFNPYYETINLDDYAQQLYRAIFSLKLMNFPNDINKYICIRSKILDNTLEVYTLNNQEMFSFEQLSLLNEVQLKDIFKDYFLKADLSMKQLDEFIHNIFLLAHKADEYIDKVIDLKVIEDYKIGNKLNR